MKKTITGILFLLSLLVLPTAFAENTSTETSAETVSGAYIKLDDVKGETRTDANLKGDVTVGKELDKSSTKSASTTSEPANGGPSVEQTSGAYIKLDDVKGETKMDTTIQGATPVMQESHIAEEVNAINAVQINAEGSVDKAVDVIVTPVSETESEMTEETDDSLAGDMDMDMDMESETALNVEIPNIFVRVWISITRWFSWGD